MNDVPFDTAPNVVEILCVRAKHLQEITPIHRLRANASPLRISRSHFLERLFPPSYLMVRPSASPPRSAPLIRRVRWWVTYKQSPDIRMQWAFHPPARAAPATAVRP